MIKITITQEKIQVNIAGVIENRRGLNAALASRLVDELQGHFLIKNKVPNKLGGKKTNFWKELSQATQVLSVDENSAVVTVADKRFNIQLYGGTIVPGPGKKALTIPLIPEAHGLFARSYEEETGRDLFMIKGKSNLYEKTSDGIRAVYALRKKVTIERDDTAMPDQNTITAALTEEADSWLKRNIPNLS